MSNAAARSWLSSRIRLAPAGVNAHRGLVALLAAGTALRVWFMLAYRPAFVGYPDAAAYITAAHGPLYWNPYKPVGYPLLLRLLHALDGRLSFTIAAQHVLGLLTAVLIYAATRPFLTRKALALLPAAVVVLGGSQVFLEHSVLSDAPYSFLLAVVLYCAARSLRGDRSVAALAVAGTALAASVTLRTVGGVLIPALALWVLARPGLHWRARAVRVSALLVPVIVILIAYLIPQHAQTGSWGLTRSGKLTFYARMAPIADCRRFSPPAGTAPLCQSSRPSTRPDANFYIFNLNSPAIRLYGVPPYPLQKVPWRAYVWRGNGPVGSFARAVLVHQPLDYLVSVAAGLANYVVPRAGRRSVFEYDQSRLISQLHNPQFERAAIRTITSYYATGAGYHRQDVSALETYGRTASTEGPLTAIFAVLMIVGWGCSRGAARSAASLFALTAGLLALLPVAVLFYDVRYAAPMVIALSAAAALGADRMCDFAAPRLPNLLPRLRRRS